jgi:hypothetical protein
VKYIRLTILGAVLLLGAAGVVLRSRALRADPAPSVVVNPAAVTQLSSQPTPITVAINASALSGAGLTPVAGYQYGVQWNPAVLRWISGPDVGPGTPTPQAVLPGCTLIVSTLGTATATATGVLPTATPTATSTSTPGAGTPTRTSTPTSSPVPTATPGGYMLVACATTPGGPTPVAAGTLGTFTFQPLATAQAGSAINLINVKLVDSEGDLVAPGPSVGSGVVNLSIAADADLDGCPDAQEALLSPATAPDNPWDFYSVPVPALFNAADPTVLFKDNVVSAGDSQAVYAYFKKGAHTGTTEYEQDLNLNGIKDGIEYDRSVVGPGQSGPPDGVISASDSQLAFVQFQHGYHC